MITLEDRLEQAGEDVRNSIAVSLPERGHAMRQRQQRRTALLATTAVLAVATIAISAARVLQDSNSGDALSAAEQPATFRAYGADLPAPWRAGAIAHDEGAYTSPYWETYNYLPTADGLHAAVVARVTARQIAVGDENAAGIPDPSTSEAFTTQVIGGRSYFVSHDQGNYTYIWRDGPDVVVEVVVIQLAPDAVTEQLATTVLSSVTSLSAQQIDTHEGQSDDIPSGPETTAPANE